MPEDSVLGGASAVRGPDAALRSRSPKGHVMCYGWLQDSIRDLIQSRWEVFDQLPYVLVTRIDSSEDMVSMLVTETIVQSEGACSLLGRSLLVGDARIVDIAQRYKLFSHFDEIWLYKEPPTIDIPEDVGIGPPLEPYAEAPSRELVDWFNASGCILGLGDGTGMSYVTKSREIAERLGDRQQGIAG